MLEVKEAGYYEKLSDYILGIKPALGAL
jgi:hypothetical protein